jgi:hypothetical protein
MLTSQPRAGAGRDLHEHAARAYCNLAALAIVQRRHADAQATLDAGLEYCTDRDLDSWTLYLQGWRRDCCSTAARRTRRPGRPRTPCATCR